VRDDGDGDDDEAGAGRAEAVAAAGDAAEEGAAGFGFGFGAADEPATTRFGWIETRPPCSGPRVMNVGGRS
jgi:hypothetical protein